LAFELQSLKADCTTASETTAGGTYVQQKKLCSGDLIFEETFDNFDLAKWEHEITLAGGGNWEFEYYNNNRTNSYTQDGNLHIRPTFLSDDTGEDFLYSGDLDVNGGAPADACTNPGFYGCKRQGTAANALNPIKSARIRSLESFSFKYGTLVVRAKLPAGDWLWPAIWLLPRYNFYGTWPSSGEIDLMESRGNKNFVNPSKVNIGTQQSSSTLHWGPTVNTNQWSRTHFEKNNASGYDTAFHEYKMVWSPTGFQFFIDNNSMGTITPPTGGFWQLGEFDKSTYSNPWRAATKMAPFDQQFYILINLAVGGTNFFGDDVTNTGGKPWKNNSPTASTDFWKGRSQWQPTWNMATDSSHFLIDSVRVYAI